MADNIKSVLVKVITSAIVVVLAFSLFSWYSLYMEYIQVKEIGENFVNVFLTNFYTQLITQFGCFVLVFLILLTNLFVVRKIMLRADVSFSYLKNRFPLVVLAFVFAFFASGYIKESLSDKFLLFSNSVWWGALDPVFNHDLSYYVFLRPFFMVFADSILGVFIFSTIMTAIIYLLLYSSLGRLNIGEIIKIKGLSVHVLTNLIIIVLIKAVSYRFNAEDILFNSFAKGLTGAGYTDANIWLKFNQITPVILILLVFLSIIFLYHSKFKSVVITILVYPIMLVGVFVSALVVQYLVVEPAENQVEAPYIKQNIEFTRMAYGLNKTTEIEFTAANNLTAADLEEEKQTIENARIIDYNATIAVTNQLQSLRDLYEFKDLDITAYKVDGKKVPYTTSVRELKKTNSETVNYISDKITYTHGYGIVTTPINRVSEEGHPIFNTRDIPLIEEAGIPKITEPRIYFGEYKDSYSIVNTSQNEFDYVEGEKNVHTVYNGKAGIKLNVLNKTLFSIHNRDYQMLVSTFINSESKILMNKNIIDRVRLVAPFLTFDEDAYILVDSSGRLKWIIDGYTTTNDIPYSQTTIDDKENTKNYNYIRNSVKAVVDAYDGTTTLYIVDEDDKLIQAYKNMYPTAFSEGKIPEDLRFSIKYPESLFKIQSEQLKRYHTTDVPVFYSRSDVWEFSYEKYVEDSRRFVEPYYNMMKVNGDFGLVIMAPFTIHGKNNMVSWLSVGSDGDNYGKMTLYKFPQGKNVYGTMQIDERIDSNAEISKVLSLWNSGDSTVLRGNIITLPIKDSLIYIEPVYITSRKSTFSELKMVIAAYGDKIAMEPDLKKAFEVLFKGGQATVPVVEKPPTQIPTPSPSPTPAPTDLESEIMGPLPTEPPEIDIEKLDKVTEAFGKVQEATKTSDWEAFGKSMKELEEAIKELEEYNTSEKTE